MKLPYTRTESVSDSTLTFYKLSYSFIFCYTFYTEFIQGGTMSYEDHKVKVTVLSSMCPKYKEGDVICFTGACLDKEHSDNVCMVAMNALYPFIYAFRRGGNLRNGPYQCTDYGETVTFKIENDL
jgi:uncharacterized repeat protein (TIGR04076 family)